MESVDSSSLDSREELRTRRLLQEAFTLSVLVFTGLVVRFTIALVDSTFFGPFEAIVTSLASLAPLILAALYGAARIGAHVARRTALRLDESASEPALDERSMPVFRGSDTARRPTSALMNRESFMITLEEALDPGTAEPEPFKLVIAKVSLAENDSVAECEIQRDVSECIARIAGTRDFAGYLGNGIFALGLVATAPDDAQSAWIDLCAQVQRIASVRNGWIEETFVTVEVGEQPGALYGRALFSLRLATGPQELDGSPLVERQEVELGIDRRR